MQKSIIDKQVEKLRTMRRELAKMICTSQYYVFSTKALKRAPTYYFEAPLADGMILARIRQHRTCAAKVSIYLNGRRRFVSPRDSKQISSIWDNRKLRDKTFKHILKDKRVPLFNAAPKNGYQVVAIARTARFRSLGQIQNLGKPSPLSNRELSHLVDRYADDQIALYL